MLRDMDDSCKLYIMVSKRTAIERFQNWPLLKHYVAHWVPHHLSFAKCQRNQSTDQKKAGLLQLLAILTHNSGSLDMDLITALPKTASGNSALVALVDRLGKMTHLATCKTHVDIVGFAKLLRHEVLRLHGIPHDLCMIVMGVSQATSGGGGAGGR